MYRLKRAVNKPARYLSTSSDEGPKRHRSTAPATITSRTLEDDIDDIQRELEDENISFINNTNKQIMTHIPIESYTNTHTYTDSLHAHTQTNTHTPHIQTHTHTQLHKLHYKTHLTLKTRIALKKLTILIVLCRRHLLQVQVHGRKMHQHTTFFNNVRSRCRDLCIIVKKIMCYKNVMPWKEKLSECIKCTILYI